MDLRKAVLYLLGGLKALGGAFYLITGLILAFFVGYMSEGMFGFSVLIDILGGLVMVVGIILMIWGIILIIWGYKMIKMSRLAVWLSLGFVILSLGSNLISTPINWIGVVINILFIIGHLYVLPLTDEKFCEKQPKVCLLPKKPKNPIGPEYGPNV